MSRRWEGVFFNEGKVGEGELHGGGEEEVAVREAFQRVDGCDGEVCLCGRG